MTDQTQSTDTSASIEETQEQNTQPNVGETQTGTSIDGLDDNTQTGQPEDTGFKLPENYAGNELFANFNSLDDVLSGYTKQQEDINYLKGRKGIPTEHTAEAWGEVVGQLPDEAKNILGELTGIKSVAPEAYEFKEIEGYKVDEGEDKFFSDAFKKHNVSQEMASDIRNDLIQGQKEFYENHVKTQDDNFDKMARDTWGADADSKVAELGAKFTELYRGSGVDEQVLREVIANPVLIPILKHLDATSRTSGGDTAIPGQTTYGSSNAMSDVDTVNKYNEVFKRYQSGDMTAKTELSIMDADPKVGAAIERYHTG